MSMDVELAAELTCYCRIDDPDEQELKLLDTLWDSAEAYLTQAGISRPDPGTLRAAQYNLLAFALVLDAYDHRDLTVVGTSIVENPSFRRQLVQMKLTEPVSNSGTGSGEG